MINSLLSCPGLTGASSTPRRSFCIPLTISALEYWVARSSRATTEEAESKRRAQGPPFYKNHFRQCWVPGRSGAPPGPDGYFFDFAFFDFFAFFAFFAFLAIVSSQGLMD